MIQKRIIMKRESHKQEELCMESITSLSHAFLKPVLHSKALCLDETLGYGHDETYFLNQKVGAVIA